MSSGDSRLSAESLVRKCDTKRTQRWVGVATSTLLLAVFALTACTKRQERAQAQTECNASGADGGDCTTGEAPDESDRRCEGACAEAKACEGSKCQTGEGELHFTDDASFDQYHFHSQMAHHGDKTYFAYEAKDRAGATHIVSYDHSRDRWEGPVKIDSNPLKKGNSHGCPSVLADKLGYVHVFYGAHGGSQRYQRSRNPGDIRSWQEMHNIDNKSTYPQPHVMSDGTIYVIYRNGVHPKSTSAPWVYRTSKDNGTTWSKKTVLLQRTPGYDHYIHSRKAEGNDVIALGISNEPRHNTKAIYYAEIRHADGTVRNAAGEVVGTMPVEELDAKCVVETFANEMPRLSHDPAITKNGTRYIMSLHRRSLARLYRWTGSSWEYETFNPRGSEHVTARGHALVLLGSGNPVIHKVTTDHGATWKDMPDIALPAGVRAEPIHVSAWDTDNLLALFLDSRWGASRQLFFWDERTGFVRR